jgi:hypothetical protein|tara:strand:- start:553 stop:789 length:237 start_codon:yes stop_codon:yes gene_type:complete
LCSQGLETCPLLQTVLQKQPKMAQKNDIAWQPIMYCVGAGIAGIAIGTLLVAPMVQKMKAKKLAEKNKKTAAVPTKKA